VVTVEDTGAGITAEVLPHVFERFYKSRDSSGTGLGLPIAKYLVEAHGGTITAESEPGKGTTIHISLPVDE
jgi:signal transduction histidine kinase